MKIPIYAGLIITKQVHRKGWNSRSKECERAENLLVQTVEDWFSAENFACLKIR